MIIQCSDLDRAMKTPELMPDARAHAESCEKCRRELFLWGEISRLAPQLHQEWESPELWSRIRTALVAEPVKQAPRWRWALVAAAAVAAIVAVLIVQPWRGSRPQQTHDFLTESALQDVQEAETAYVRSIDRLSAIAAPVLERSPSPLAASYREKLVVLDSAIADLKTNLENNRYNTYLQTELASLYREKQKTLQEWLEHEKRN